MTGVNAHNHQHLFCLRAHGNIDGPNNTVFVSDTVASDAPVGSAENFYGNAFGAKRTKLTTEGQSRTDYDGSKSRTWEICNTNRLHPYSGKPASYKLVSREVPGLLPKEGSLVWKRAGFARHAVQVTKCKSMWSPFNPPGGRVVGPRGKRREEGGGGCLEALLLLLTRPLIIPHMPLSRQMDRLG